MPKARRQTRSRSSSRSRSNSTPVTSPADKSPKSPARGKSPGRSKSPAKSKSPGRSKSPARSKSPGRSKSPARSKSPSRNKSPARAKSPSRTKSPAIDKSPVRSKSPRRSKSPARSIPKKQKPKAEPTPPTRVSSRIASLVEEKKLQEAKVILKSVIQTKEFEEQKKVKDEKAEEEAKKDEKVEDEKKIRKTSQKEFGGTIGVLFFMIALPAMVFTLIQMCHKNACNIWTVPKIPKNWKYYLDPKAAAIVVGWFFVQAFLAIIPFGKIVDGQPLVDGTRLRYRCNGFRAFVFTLLLFAIGVYMQVPFTMVYDKLFSLMVASTIFSIVLSIIFYIKSRRAPALALAPGGNTGSILYDFFMGHELNPRLGSLDFKLFFDLRMSLLTWLVINLCFVLKANQDKDGCPPALIAVTIFQGLYVADALWFEEAFLTTMDILHDGFGFMLTFGNLVFVPFLYSMQGLYLVRHRVALPYYILAVITFLKVVGYVIFRGSNSQKNEFRRDPFKPSMAHLDSIPTISGRRLLVSGWWKLCRKPNYLGDIIMAVSWSLTCGFGSVVPYFYPIFITLFLIHRERRDAANCQRKHGISWERYCNAVKYRIFPYIY